MNTQRIVAADGSTIAESASRTLVPDFMARCKAKGEKPMWGDYRRIMKVRRDEPNVIMKCAATGERLIDV